MSSGDTNRKTRPEIKVAINELVERHVAYYQGWLSSRARKQTSLPLTQQIPQHDDATPPQNAIDRTKDEPLQD